MNRPRPLSLRLYALATCIASPLAPLILRRRAARGKEEPSRLGERLGHAGVARPDGPLIWLHGASVGEGLSLLPLVFRFHSLRADVTILVTTGTRASAEVLPQRLPENAFHQFAPIDTPAAVTRFIGHWRPNLGVFVESELWPNLIWSAKTSGARMALVSAKMSVGSSRAWRFGRGAARAVLRSFDLILARDESARKRLEALGARIDGVWDAKLGAQPLPSTDEDLRRLRSVIGSRPVILAASTHPGEEALIARAFAVAIMEAPGALLIVVPRHADRGPAVEGVMLEASLNVARRSLGYGPAHAQVLVADTLGELGLWYRLAALAIVGGSLVAGVGGHNPLEPARLDCPFIAGDQVDQWPIYADLAEAGATRLLVDPGELAKWMSRALAGDPALRDMADRAAAFAALRDEQSQTVAPRLLNLLAL